MKKLFVLLCAGALMAACGDGAGNGDAPMDNPGDLQAYAAKADKFPSVSGDAYAPWARMKGEAFHSVHPDDAPKASRIDIPPYPGSHIVRSGRIGDGGGALDFVTLICEDSYEAVIGFYKKRLIEERGWTYEDQYHVFQPGKDNEFILLNTPFVSVMDINPESSEMKDVDPEFLSHFRTRIQVSYRPSR
jgi:hypothetical protein